MVPLGEWLAWEEVFAAQPAPRSTVQKAAYRPTVQRAILL